MDSFFSKIKNMFAVDYGGRYLSYVLSEVIRQEPKVAETLWNNEKIFRNKKFLINEEWCFSDRNRRADIAAIGAISREPIALLEIKYEDHKKPENEGQLSDYLDFCDNRDEPIPFVYLTKHLPPKSDLELVGKERHLSYSQLAKNLSFIKASPVVEMLIQYLKEEGYMFQENISRDSLILLIVNCTNFPYNHGFGRLTTHDRMASDVPRTFQALLNNTGILGNRFHDHICSDFFKLRPTVEFKFAPYVDANKAAESFHELKDNEEGEYVAVTDDLVKGGEFWITASTKLPGGDEFLFLRFGIYCYLEKGWSREEALQISLFSRIDGRRIDPFEEEEYISLNISEDVAYKTILQLAGKMLPKCIEEQGEFITTPQKSILEQISGRVLEHL